MAILVLDNDNEYAESGFYSSKKKKSAGALCCSFLCSHVGLFIVVAAYAVVGKAVLDLSLHDLIQCVKCVRVGNVAL